MSATFSERHGLRPPEPEITAREEAPQALRDAVVLLARRAGMSFYQIREVVCEVLLVRPDPNNWSEEPNISGEVFWRVGSCDWFNVYDIAESIWSSLQPRTMYAGQEREQQALYTSRLNEVFRREGLGWLISDGVVQYRGAEPFMHATAQATAILDRTGKSVAAREMSEAIRDISRRPTPDITGAVQHSWAALEATARDVTQDPKVLGRLIHELDLPKPLDAAVHKLWGFASQQARHGNEDSTINIVEAELLVGVAASLCAFLIARQRDHRA